MADVVLVPPVHIPAIEKVKRGEDITRDGNRNEIDIDIDIDFHLWLEQDRCEEDRRHGPGSTDCAIRRDVLKLQEVPNGGYDDGAEIQDDVKGDSRPGAECRREIVLHHAAEEVQGEHVEEQVPPAAVDESVGNHPIPFFAMPDTVGREPEPADIQLAVEAEGAHQARDGYDDDGCQVGIKTLSTCMCVTEDRSLIRFPIMPTYIRFPREVPTIGIL